MKKFLTFLMVFAVILLAATGCASANTPGSSESSSQEATMPTGKINAISREDGSGTRGAFIELFEIEEKDADGNKVDNTTDTAEITNSTSVMMTTVAGDPSAIGYISLGSLNETVKAVKINDVAPSAEGVKDGSYAIFRPFNIATKGDISEIAQDFINFILSKEGQDVVEEKGYIRIDDTGSYTAVSLTGKIVIAGSSSVTPVMEALKEAYVALNTSAEIEIQQSDSTTGMNSAIEGICDIGMASREVKDSELEAGLTPTVIAMDGIAVVVNNDNPLENLTNEQVKNIYIGTTENWEDIG